MDPTFVKYIFFYSLKYKFENVKFYKIIFSPSKCPLREGNNVAIPYVSHALTGDCVALYRLENCSVSWIW